MRVIAACLLVVWSMLSACAPGPLKSWGERDRWLWSLNTSCQILDYQQTRDVLDNGGRELNPLIGESPSTERLAAFKLGGLALSTWSMDAYPETRGPMLMLLTAGCVAVVASNYKEGARP